MSASTWGSDGQDLRALSLRQLEAIECLAAGMTVDRVAFMVGVSPVLISRWRRTDLAFRLALVARQGDPRPPKLDVFELMLARWLKTPEPEQPWASEDRGRESGDGDR